MSQYILIYEKMPYKCIYYISVLYKTTFLKYCCIVLRIGNEYLDNKLAWSQVNFNIFS